MDRCATTRRVEEAAEQRIHADSEEDAVAVRIEDEAAAIVTM